MQKISTSNTILWPRLPQFSIVLLVFSVIAQIPLPFCIFGITRCLEFVRRPVFTLSRVRRLHKTGIGLTTGFIKHSYNTWLHFTVPCNTHTQHIQGVQSSRKHDCSVERTERFPATAVPFPASAAVPFPAIESAVVSLIPHISLYMHTFIRIL
jgi:hypothetical protein